MAEKAAKAKATRDAKKPQQSHPVGMRMRAPNSPFP
jgi:hypothetical protein